MNHIILRQVIADNLEIIRSEKTIGREYTFDPSARYILTGLRRAGKSILLHRKVLELVESGVSWSQIIYINFEDERLAEFSIEDFNDIVITAAELSDKEPYYFFDEIQNIDGWERFARRLADGHANVWITGSNAKMLSSEMESRLGARYLSENIMPYSFREYLNALDIPFDERSRASAKGTGAINRALLAYMKEGGFPESLQYLSKQAYAESIYQKILLGDIAARNGIRNAGSLRILMKKIAETVMHEVSYNRLSGAVTGAGAKLSVGSVIQYIGYAKEAYLIFTTSNYFAKFTEQESTPCYYFTDNALLNLFLVNKDSALFENMIASALHRKYGEHVWYMKSPKVDVDFYIPETHQAVQAALELEESSRERELKSLAALSATFKEAQEFIIVTRDQTDLIETENCTVHVIKASDFLLDL